MMILKRKSGLLILLFSLATVIDFISGTILPAAAPKKNIIRIHIIKKNELPESIILYASWNKLSKTGLGLEFTRRLSRSWGISCDIDYINNSKFVPNSSGLADIKESENLNYRLFRSTVSLDWLYRKKNFGFIIGGGLGLSGLEAKSYQEILYYHWDAAGSRVLTNRETGRYSSVILTDKFGLDIFMPGNWILNRIFVEVDLTFNIRTMTDKTTTAGFENRTYSYSGMGVVSSFSNGWFFKAGVGFLF